MQYFSAIVLSQIIQETAMVNPPNAFLGLLGPRKDVTVTTRWSIEKVHFVGDHPQLLHSFMSNILWVRVDHAYSKS